MLRCNAESQKRSGQVLFLKITAGLCPSSGYYSMVRGKYGTVIGANSGLGGRGEGGGRVLQPTQGILFSNYKFKMGGGMVSVIEMS